MKKIFLITGMMIILISNYVYAQMWEDFESRQWIPESYGGEQPTLTYDSTRFPGRTAICASFTGLGSYGFLHTGIISNENWSTVSAVQAEVYFEDSFAGDSNNPTTKLEAKDPNGVSYEFLVQYLTKNNWQTVTWPLRSQNSTASYDTISWVILNIESFLGYAAMTAYFDNLRLVFNDGHIEPWDNFDRDTRQYVYGGRFNTSNFSGGPVEVISHRHASPENPAGAAYLAWSWDSAPEPTYAEIAATNLNNNTFEDWSKFSTIRYDVYTSNTSARYKIFLWDGNSGYAPDSKIVTLSNTWTRLQFDISSAGVYAQNTSFDRGHITQFKCVVEYLDVPGASSGEAYFDNIILMEVGPTYVEKWLYFE